MHTAHTRRPWHFAIVLMLAASAASGCDAQGTAAAPPRRARAPRAANVVTRDTGDAALRAAHAAERRDVPIEFSAVVTKLLKDDREGSRHQRFLVKAAGLSVLVAHNIDLAPRAPVVVGATVRLRGEYVWNDKGGVMHWTHRDPRGRHPGGFIEVAGQRIE